MSIEDLTILTQRIVSSNNESSNPVKITGDAGTDKKIQEYFNKHTKNDKASNPTDTLSEVYAKYDTNHNGRLDRSERKAAGMTRSEARAFNRAMKAFGGDDGEIKSNALNDNSGTMYTKDGKFLFSIQNQNGDTVTTLYKDNKPESRTTENQNYTKTEENFNAGEKALTTTYKYTESYSASNNGLTQETTIIADDGKVTTTKDYTGRQDSVTKEVIVQENAEAAERTVTTYKGADDTTGTTVTQIKNETGVWTDKPAEEPEPATENPEPEEKPEEETGQNAALEALKDGFDKGNKISVTIQGGQTKLSSGDYQGTINLPAGETFEEGKMPQTLFMTLPQGSTGKMKLTYDENTGLYTTTRGDRQFRITADNGKITMEAFTDNQEVQKKLNRNIDESKTKIDLSKSYTAESRSVNATLLYDNTSSWENANLDDSTKSKVQQYFDLSSVCLADAVNMDKNKLTIKKNSNEKSMSANLPDGRWIQAIYNNDGKLEKIAVSFNNAKDYNVGENRVDWEETVFSQNYAHAHLAHNQDENDYCISGDAYSFDNIKAAALKIFPETWPEE